ncbi:MAG: preprotein translocase subunit SecE [Spirochaetota bacterium]
MKNVIAFLKESREELGKVTWPTRDEVTRFTFVTVVTVIVVSLFLWMVDSVLMKIIQMVMK